MTEKNWNEKLTSLYEDLYQREAWLNEAKKLVTEAVFHREIEGSYEHQVVRAQKRLMERLPMFFAASIEHAKAKRAVHDHREKKTA